MKKILLLLLLSFNLNAAQTSIAIIKDVKANNTHGGSSSDCLQRLRAIATLYVAQDWVSVASNTITLDAGSYMIKACSPAARVGRHKIALYRPSDTAYLVYGTSEQTNNSTDSSTDSCLTAIVSPSVSTGYQIRHTCSNAAGTYGLGHRVNFGGSEIYTTVIIEKL